MATLEEIVVQLTAESSQLRAELASSAKATQQASDKMEAAIKQFTENSSKNTSFFESAMASMTGFLGSQAVLGAFNALKGLVGDLTNELIDGAKEAIAEEQALTRLSSALKLSGQFTDEALKSLEDYSNEMEGVAQVSAEVIASNLAMLSSLTKLDSQGLRSAETAAIDLSAALGKDLSTASEMVAKAINGNDMAFKKLGINLDLTGDKTQNLLIITDAIQKQFGGAAAARVQTFGGALFVLRDAWGDMFKEVSKAVTQNRVVIDFMNSLSKVFSELTASISKENFADGISKGFLNLIDILSATVLAVDTFSMAFMAAIKALALPIVGLIEGVANLKNALSGDDVDWSWTKGLTESLSDTVNNRGLSDFITNALAEVKASAEVTYKQYGSLVGGATKATEGQIAKTNELSEAEKNRLSVVIDYAKAMAEQNKAIDDLYTFQSEMLQLQLDAQFVTQEEFFATKLQQLTTQMELENAAIAEAREKGKLTETEYQAAIYEQAQKNSLAIIKLNNDRAKAEEETNKLKLQQASDFAGAIVGLAKASNSELGGLGKAAAIAQATIDGYVAVQKAWAQGGFFGAGMAAVVAATTAANVAKIAGTPGFAKGINSVPGVGNQDNFPAMLAPGERVVPAKSNEDLTDFLQSQGENAGPQIILNLNIGTLIGPDPRELGDELIELINNRLQSGGQRLLV